VSGGNADVEDHGSPTPPEPIAVSKPPNASGLEGKWGWVLGDELLGGVIEISCTGKGIGGVTSRCTGDIGGYFSLASSEGGMGERDIPLYVDDSQASK